MTAYRLALGLIVIAVYGGIFLLRALGRDALYQSLLRGRQARRLTPARAQHRA